MVCLLLVTLLTGDALDDAREAIERKDVAAARALLEPLAEKDNVAALLLLGQVSKPKEAVKWYTRAAELNSAEAHYRLGLLERLPSKRKQHLRRAMRAGHREAKFRLALLLGKKAEGRQLLRECALESHPGARARVMQLRYDDHVWLFDENTIEGWVVEGAEQGHPEAQYRLANLFVDDDRKEIEWLRKAAEGGHTQAQLQLGLKLRRWEAGNHRVEAERWLLQAVVKGEDEAADCLYGIYLSFRKPAVECYAWRLLHRRMSKAVGTWTREREASFKLRPRLPPKELAEARKRAAELWKTVAAGVKKKLEERK